MGEGTLGMYPGLCSGPGLEAVGTAKLQPSSQWAQVGTEVTCPPGEKAEAHFSWNEFSVLVPEGGTLTKYPSPSLPSPLPVLHLPAPGHSTARAEPSVKFSVNITEMFPALGSDGRGFLNATEC